jgi:hypothetical protein
VLRTGRTPTAGPAHGLAGAFEEVRTSSSGDKTRGVPSPCLDLHHPLRHPRLTHTYHTLYPCDPSTTTLVTYLYYHYLRTVTLISHTLTMSTSSLPTQTAIVLHGPKDMRLEQRPLFPPRQGECQVRVISTGLCGSDRTYSCPVGTSLGCRLTSAS